MIDLKRLDNVTKLLLILLIGVLIYFAIFSILKPFFITEPTPVMSMMSQMIGSDMINFSSGYSTTMNLISLIIAIGIAIIVSFYLFKSDKIDEYSIIRKALSEDEKRILDEIKKTGEITQDSLRFRLNWSKAKVSTILTNLDRKNLIQRERTGKTYKVYLQKQLKTV